MKFSNNSKLKLLEGETIKEVKELKDKNEEKVFRITTESGLVYDIDKKDI